jgi:biopolymer transport protein ExbD
MSGVSVDSGKSGGRKSVDSAVNMVPMIDLLISVIAFLLMTAVWVQTGAVRSEQPRGPAGSPEPAVEHLKIAITATGFRIGMTAMDMRDIARSPQQLDALRTMLTEWHRANATEQDVQIQPDSTVPYNEIIEVMDAVYDVWNRGRPAREPLTAAVRVQLL